MKSKLFIVFFSCFLMFNLSTLVAEGNQEVISNTDEIITLTMLVDNQQDLTGFKAVAEAAKKKLGIELEIELRPGGAEGDNLLKTRLISGEMTDLNFYNSGSLFMSLTPENYFVDLSTEPFMDTVYDSYKATVSVGDGVYAVPSATMMTGGWFYNKRVYEELGLKVPTTWVELMNNCELILGSGTVPVITPYADSWTAQLVILGDYYNVYAEYPNFADDYTANKAKYADTPIALRGFEKLNEIYKKGYNSPNPVSTNFEDALFAITSGDGAHFPMLSFALPSFASIAPDKIDDIGFFPQPGDKPESMGATMWMPAGIAIYKESKKVEAAKKWLEFFISPEGIAAFMSTSKPQGPFAVKGIELPEDVYEAVKDLMPYVEADKTVAALEFLSPIKGPDLPQLSVQVGIDIESPAVTAEQYDRDVEKQAKQLGLAGW